MNLLDYQPLARRTMKELPTYREHMDHMTLGINGELGEIADAIKKFSIYGKGVDPTGALDENGKVKAMLVKDGGILDVVNMSEEGGDCWWYIVGYVPELMGADNVTYGLEALHEGFIDGASKALYWREGPVRLITQAQAQVAQTTLNLLTDSRVLDHIAAQSLQILGRSMGLYYGYFNLALDSSLERNIAKLAKRYGDKYSDYAALNRDLVGERQVLEEGAKGVAEANKP